MKNNLFPAFILAMSVFFISCRTDKPDPLPQGPTCSVRLKIDRERMLDESDEPLAMVKGTPHDLYAVQVYRKSSLGGKDGKYAYGIFDNENDMNLELETGNTYKIEMTMVPDGASLIAKGENGGYQEPFVIGGAGGAPGKTTNRFISSTVQYIEKLNSGYAVINREDDEPTGYNRPPISRFYGVADNFTPTGNTELAIDLKWVCFGLTVVPQDFTEGRIEIEMRGAPLLTVTPDAPDAVTKKIFTFEHSLNSDDWTADDYSENIPIAITWFKSDGTSIVFRDIATPTSIKRKVNKIFSIPCGNDGPAGNIAINKEDEILVDDEEIIARPQKNVIFAR